MQAKVTCMYTIYFIVLTFFNIFKSNVTPDDGIICWNIYIESAKCLFLIFITWEKGECSSQVISVNKMFHLEPSARSIEEIFLISFNFDYHNVSFRANAKILRYVCWSTKEISLVKPDPLLDLVYPSVLDGVESVPLEIPIVVTPSGRFIREPLSLSHPLQMYKRNFKPTSETVW
jgi:hypothetical protein